MVNGASPQIPRRIRTVGVGILNVVAVLTIEKGVGKASAPYALEEDMRHAILMAGISILAITGSALAHSSTPLHLSDAAAADMRLAQVQIQAPPGTVVTTPSLPSGAVVTTPGSSPIVTTPSAGSNPASTTVVVAPTAPPPPQAETPPPAPGPSYVWRTGHWWWDGAQYVWKPGRYVMPPTTVARWRPGYWQEGPSGWFWVDGSWN
jgi:YXWGXW repeat-containing protein